MSQMKFLWAAFSLLFWWGLYLCGAARPPVLPPERAAGVARAPAHRCLPPAPPPARGAPPARRARHFLSAPRARGPALRPGRAAAAAAAATEVQVPPPGDSRLLARRPWHQAFTPLSRLTLRPPHRPAKCRPSPSPRRSVGSWKVTPWPSPRPPPGPLGSPSGAELAARPETPGAPKTGLSFQLHHPHRLLEPQDFSSPQLCTARFSSCPLRVPFTPLSSTFAFCSGVSTPPRHLRPDSWGAPHVTLRGLGPDPFSLGQPSPPRARGGLPSSLPSPKPLTFRLRAPRGSQGAARGSWDAVAQGLGVSVRFVGAESPCLPLPTCRLLGVLLSPQGRRMP